MGLFSSIKKIPSGRKKEGYDEKANVAACEALAMNIDEVVEGLEEE